MSQPVSEWSHLEFDLADRLRRALRISNTSVQEMADELDLDRNSVSRYINGHTRPARSALIVWAMKTGVPIEWIENGENPRRSAPGGGSFFVMPEPGSVLAPPIGLEPITLRFPVVAGQRGVVVDLDAWRERKASARADLAEVSA